jgi:hypothetical protein
MAHAWRVTGRDDVKNRIVAMADFLDQYGLDPTYDYVGSSFGIVGGQVYHNYANANPVTFWDPVYTTALVNTMVWAYKFTGDMAYYDRAKYFFNRGTKGIYGSPTQRECADNVCGHFVDTKFSSVSGYFYYDYNKGELQYTYMMFEDPNTAVEGRPAEEAEAVSVAPNPFNPMVQIKVRSAACGVQSMKIRIFNTDGKLVETLTPHTARSTQHSFAWNASGLPSGVYILKADLGSKRVAKRLVLQR